MSAAVNLLSSLKEKACEESLQDGSKHDEDEEGGGVGGGGDPAVLARGPARAALRYSREDLLRLRNSPLSRGSLDDALKSFEALALVLKKRPESPGEEDRGARGDAPADAAKPAYRERGERRDPRERVRRESESGIVLSPQRRSFVSGCAPPRPDSPPKAKAEPPGRRIGSGRIMVRDVTAAPWERPLDESEPYRPPAERQARAQPDRAPAGEPARTEAARGGGGGGGGGGGRFERGRGFGRDGYGSDIKREREERFNVNDKMRDREDNRRSGSGRYGNRRYDKDEEPEWFSGGPTSKLETIELRGFDEPVRHPGRDENSNGDAEERAPPAAEPAAPEPAPHANDNESSEAKKGEAGGAGGAGGALGAGGGVDDFNIDEFLKFDSIPDVLTNGREEGGSRFSRWFRRESPPPDNKHYEKLLHNMVDELEVPPQDVFAPISPAPPAPPAPPSLLALLRRAEREERAPGPAGPPEVEASSKMHSLEELEARLRPPPAARADHDLSAFKRLLAQVSGGHAVPAAEQPRAPPPQPQPQPMSLLQMLNKSVEQQKAQQHGHHQHLHHQQHQHQQHQHQQHQHAPPPPQSQQPHIPQELLYKLLQVQRQQQPAASPERAEALARGDAGSLLAALRAGDVTAAQLLAQLHAPALPPRTRDLLLHVLRLNSQMGASPLPAAPHLSVPHHQPLRLSPLPHNAYSVSPIMATSPNALTVHHPVVPARIPSPRELAVHTQSIMQGALIKKKLEEQRENYRRRHELQHAKPTPISFTPTSVLRKMTAEKEAEAPSPKQQWAPPPKVPQGRPIVKGNQGGGAPPASYQPAADYQHQLSRQQQMANAIRPFPHQQRQVPPTQLGGGGGGAGGGGVPNLTRGVPSGTTLQQLFAASQQAGGLAAGDADQLSRWFSPELLARAHAGKLPSLRVPNVLSLEELERPHQSPAVRN